MKNPSLPLYFLRLVPTTSSKSPYTLPHHAGNLPCIVTEVQYAGVANLVPQISNWLVHLKVDNAGLITAMYNRNSAHEVTFI